MTERKSSNYSDLPEGRRKYVVRAPFQPFDTTVVVALAAACQKLVETTEYRDAGVNQARELAEDALDALRRSTTMQRLIEKLVR